jgi:hypothetical protein
MLLEERAVTTIKDIDFWVGELRILGNVDSAILVTDEGGPVAMLVAIVRV